MTNYLPGSTNPVKEPLYNIGAVAQMTDIPETTLRVWERRYNFPHVARTEGGHRLYSQHEVARLHWVKQRLDEGMQISSAIKALRHMEQTGEPIELTTPQAASLARLSDLAKHLTEVLIAHDMNQADHILAQASVSYPLEQVILQLISPALNRIGSLWENGEIDVASEHLASHFLRQYLLLWLRVGPPAYEVNPVALACGPGELHEGSLLMLAALLRRRRWPVAYLGQTILFEDFAGFVRRLHPSAIVLVAMTDEAADELARWPQWLPEIYASAEPPLCFGGRIFTIEPAYIDRVPGIFLGSTLEEGIVKLDALLRDRNPYVR